MTYFYQINLEYYKNSQYVDNLTNKTILNMNINIALSSLEMRPALCK